MYLSPFAICIITWIVYSHIQEVKRKSTPEYKEMEREHEQFTMREAVALAKNNLIRKVAEEKLAAEQKIVIKKIFKDSPVEEFEYCDLNKTDKGWVIKYMESPEDKQSEVQSELRTVLDNSLELDKKMDTVAIAFYSILAVALLIASSN